ncbi:uncharacterized protein A4U43_C07F27240 [Asparagus officinalis]|uniref:Uncharacterized protein n=1 Tax=Asparagus officinalis TaxID=4686 RepID=A0A5P1EF77_ASPOF|nr:uncharacterized protein A4U43_C07F27240 [Asparagus officinalis]
MAKGELDPKDLKMVAAKAVEFATPLVGPSAAAQAERSKKKPRRMSVGRDGDEEDESVDDQGETPPTTIRPTPAPESSTALPS